MIMEPYASMILSEEKTIETRTWKTKYRGDILLCASKKPESAISGHAFAVVELVFCEIYDRAYSWVFKYLRKIKPFPVKGQLGLFEVKYEHTE